MNVLFAGHSFVHRLLTWMRTHQNRELSSHNPALDVYIHSIGGARIMGPRSMIPEIKDDLGARDYDVVIIHLGNNDIAGARTSDDIRRIVQYYVYQAADINIVHGVKVILCREVPRGNRLFPGNAARTSLFNLMLEDAVRDLGNPQVRTWRLHGLHQPSGNILIQDQVHLSANGTVRYYNSIRAATRYFLP